MNARKPSGRRQSPRLVDRRRGFERLEDRRVMAIVLGQSTFNPALMGDNIELMSDGNAVGYGYAVSYQGNPFAAGDGGGQSRTAQDEPAESFTQLTKMDLSSVSKTVTATAILHILESQPGGLDAALSTPLADYLPSDWTPGDNVQFVTLRHLLTHTSGFKSDADENPINVNFGAPSNATYVNLRNLVQAGVAAPSVGFDADYHGPRWSGSYNNANFALLARVVLPKLVFPGINLTAANYADRDLTSGTIYKQYVRDEVFEPLGIFGADLDVTDPNPTMGYFLDVDEPGEAPVDRTRTGGAGGWKLSARDLAKFLDGIQRDNSILTAATRQMRDEQELGWYQTENAFGESFSHNGANGGDQGLFRSQIVAMPGDVEVGYLMNSGWSSLPGGNIFSMLETAYVNAWSDLTVAGTSGDDDFVLRLDNSGFLPSVEVELNGEVLFSHWVSTLDSLTLNGGSGSDTFTILGWNSSIDLDVNGGTGDDVVSVLPGVRNIETVSGMTYNGGSGVDRIVVNDQLNPYSNPAVSRLYTVTDGSVARFRQNPAFPGNPGMFLPVVVNFAGVEDLDLTTGAQSDVASVVSMPSDATRIRTGAGDDVIVVAETAGNLESVDGLEVDGQAGLDEIRLFDHNKTSADPLATAQYDVDAESVSRYMASLGGFVDGPPVGVGVSYDNVENLQLTTTDLVDVIRVHTTPAGETTIHGGAGNDSLVASPNGRNLELVDDLTFNGAAGLDAIVLNDQDNPYSHAALSGKYDVSAAGVSRTAAMGIDILLLPVAINVDYSSVEDLTLRTGGQDDEVDVESTPFAGATIQTGAGDDVVHASPTSRNFETVNGLQVDGSAGADALHIYDQNNPYELPGGADYTITPATVGRFAEHVLLNDFAVPVELGFANVESVSLAAGGQQDRFDVEGVGGAAALTLVGNGGADDFHVTSPAFASATIAGDAPLLAPGDQLVVNEHGLYAVATIPGLYPAGAGGVSIDAMTISYTGIEQPSIQPQIYGGLGDFDGNGLVDGVDLTHATLGWKARFGDDLDGRDFLIWQRNLGANRLPHGGRIGSSVETAKGTTAPAGDDATPTTLSLEPLVAREAALAAYAIGGALDEDDETDAQDASWDAALAELAVAMSI
jgi:CubicO group peptidase (beta-lactamase class C family)